VIGQEQARRAQLLSQLNLPAGERARPTPGHTPAWHYGSPPGSGTGRPRREPSTDWVTQGPEQPSPTWVATRGRVAGYAVAAAVLVTVMLVALLRDDTPVRAGAGAAGTSTALPPWVEQRPSGLPVMPEPPATRLEPADNAAALVDPPGQARSGGGPFDITTLATKKLLPETVVRQLTRDGLVDGLFKTTVDGAITYSLLALRLPTPQNAVNSAREYGYTQQEGGLLASADLSLHGVPVYSASAPDGGGFTYRAVYVLYTRVIVVDVAGPGDSAQAAFKALLDAQVRTAPPTDRSLN
jgi:hypothetical protein